MDLYRVNQLLTETSRELSELAIAQTIENKAIRAHRYASSIRVTDLANAGKRGKSVDEFALYDLDYGLSPATKQAIESFAKKLHTIGSYKDALREAETIIRVAEKDAQFAIKNNEKAYRAPSIEKSRMKGVHVAPGGFKKIEVQTPFISLRADNDSFSVRDKKDTYNEQTCIAPVRAKATAVKKF